MCTEACGGSLEDGQPPRRRVGVPRVRRVCDVDWVEDLRDVSRTCRGRVAGESWTCRGRVAGVSRGLGGAIRSSGGGARHRAQHKEVPEAKPGRQGGEHASVPAGGESCAAGASGRAGTRLGELPDKEGPVRLDQPEAGGDAAVLARPVHLEGVVGVQQRLRAAGKTSRGTARKARRGRVPDTSRARRGGKSSITHRCISAASRLHLGCISAASRLHLGYISPRGGASPTDQGAGASR